MLRSYLPTSYKTQLLVSLSFRSVFYLAVYYLLYAPCVSTYKLPITINRIYQIRQPLSIGSKWLRPGDMSIEMKLLTLCTKITNSFAIRDYFMYILPARIVYNDFSVIACEYAVHHYLNTTKIGFKPQGVTLPVFGHCCFSCDFALIYVLVFSPFQMLLVFSIQSKLTVSCKINYLQVLAWMHNAYGHDPALMLVPLLVACLPVASFAIHCVIYLKLAILLQRLFDYISCFGPRVSWGTSLIIIEEVRSSSLYCFVWSDLPVIKVIDQYAVCFFYQLQLGWWYLGPVG